LKLEVYRQGARGKRALTRYSNSKDHIDMDTKPSSTLVDRIVCLDECHCEIPPFSFPHTYTGYPNTPTDLLAERVKDATIIITTRVPLSAATISQCSPELRLIGVMAAGFDHIDLGACRGRGISVCNIPSASGESDAEHAITLCQTVHRRVVELDESSTGVARKEDGYS